MVIDEDIYLEHFDDETIIDEDVEVFLEHYGVKGMKWGVRNAPNNLKKSFLVDKNELKLPKREL